MPNTLAQFDLKDLKDVNIRRLLAVRRYLLLAIVMVFTTVAVIVLAVLPQVQQIVETVGAIQQQNEVLKNLQRKVQGLAQVNDLAEYSRKDAVDQALPVRKPLLQVLENTRQVATSSGVKIENVETSPGKLATGSGQKASSAVAPPASGVTPAVAAPKQVYGVDKMDIAVKISGNLSQISEFIRQIELTTPILSVTQVSLSDTAKVGTSTTTREFSADLRLSAYYFTRAIEVAIDAPLPETGAKERQFLQDLEQYAPAPQVTQSQQVEGGGRQDLFGIGAQMGAEATETPAPTIAPVQ